MTTPILINRGVINLLSSCEDCNAGKSDRPIGKVISPKEPASDVE